MVRARWLITLYCLCSFSGLVKAQPSQKAKTCKQSYELVQKVWNNDSDSATAIRQYMTKCRDNAPTAVNVRLYGHLGAALIHLHSYSEALPILELCRNQAQASRLVGDLANCWELYGEASERIGHCVDAKAAFQAAMEIPPIDNLSHDAHELAKLFLDHWPYYTDNEKCVDTDSVGRQVKK
jgi:hypothetical protein